MIFIDSNVPMYLIGAAHPNKSLARTVLERLVVSGERLVSDAEVLQEIVHRYGAIGRLDAIEPAFQALEQVVDELFPIFAEDVRRASVVLRGSAGISSRDALHYAVMQRAGVSRIFSFDSGFDRLTGIERIQR